MTMDPRLQAWLDGDIEFEALPETLRGAAEAWSELLENARSDQVAGAPLGATARVMDAIRADASGGAGSRVVAWASWLFRPRPIRISPLAAAAAIALVAWSVTRIAVPQAGVESVDDRVYVQFLISAPEARTVALAGDFNEWDPSIQLDDPDGDGLWSARVALEPGVHEYMFVIDGSEWRPDPNALSYTDDGFGQQNSVLAVTPVDET
ncbi:MAG: glycogen-binding domain-containing protein [Gemmatimonadota bacterium]